MFKNYWKPTPVFWRKVGDSLLITGTVITSYSIYNLPSYFTIISLGLTVIGKILTNLFEEK